MYRSDSGLYRNQVFREAVRVSPEAAVMAGFHRNLYRRGAGRSDHRRNLRRGEQLNLWLYHRRFHHPGLCADQPRYRHCSRNHGKARTHEEAFRRCFNGMRGRICGSSHLHTAQHPVLGRYYRQPLGRRGIRMVSGFRPSGSVGLLPGRGDRRCPG